MAFNHYAKIKRILDEQPDGWFIKRIDEPTSARNFKNEKVNFAYYYRVYSRDNEPLKYCKFQQLDRLANILKVPIESLPLI